MVCKALVYVEEVTAPVKIICKLKVLADYKNSSYSEKYNYISDVAHARQTSHRLTRILIAVISLTS